MATSKIIPVSKRNFQCGHELYRMHITACFWIKEAKITEYVVSYVILSLISQRSCDTRTIYYVTSRYIMRVGYYVK